MVQALAVGRTTISLTSTSSGCSMAKRTARAIASGFSAMGFAEANPEVALDITVTDEEFDLIVDPKKMLGPD